MFFVCPGLPGLVAKPTMFSLQTQGRRRSVKLVWAGDILPSPTPLLHCVDAQSEPRIIFAHCQASCTSCGQRGCKYKLYRICLKTVGIKFSRGAKIFKNTFLVIYNITMITNYFCI
uniref:Uncharacterized protein n=1 Tax=Pararge aegeria TaxID=116150 RepID=S4NXM7_9NEOP